jgi:hypothetical protein
MTKEKQFSKKGEIKMKLDTIALHGGQETDSISN